MEDIKNTNEQTTEKKGGEKKSNKTALIVAGIIIVILIAIIIYLVMPKNEKRNVVVTPDNVEETAQQMEEAAEDYVAPGYYTVTMNYDWTFESGTAVSEDAYVENVTENTNDIYFDVYLEDDPDTVIYSSPIIPLGSYINTVALDEDLDAGTYDCVCEYHLVDEDQNTLSTVSVSVTITVEN